MAVLAMLVLVLPLPAQTSRPPNILFILCDDLGIFDRFLRSGRSRRHTYRDSDFRTLRLAVHFHF